MKLFTVIALAALFSVTACSHKSKSCCAKKEVQQCSKEDSKKACCKDGSCEKPKKK